jgi:hypothetical protein
MNPLRRAAFFALVVLPSAAVLSIACSQGGALPPPPPAETTKDSGPAPVRDSGQLDTTPPDTGAMDTAPADTFEAAVDACDAGSADGGAAIVGPSSIQFGNMGLVNCGTQAMAQTITVTNASCEPFNWTGVLTSGASFYMLSPAAGMMLAPGATQTIQVVPIPIPQTSVVTPDYYEGTVNITTTAPNDTGHIIQLHETAYGVILESTLGAAFGFGGVAIGQTATNQFSVSNNGNAPTTVTFMVGSMYFGVTPSFSIPANMSVAPVVKFSPVVVQGYTDMLITSIPAGTPVCGPIPANTLLTGSGTTGIAVSPTSLDFGTVQCAPQAQAALQTITITNTGAAATYSPSFALGPNSPYTLAAYNPGMPTSPGAPITPGTGNSYPLAMASSLTIDIVPKAIPNPASTSADGYADTLTITTTGMGDVPHNIGLHQTAQGTIFTLNPAAFPLSGTPAITGFTPYAVGNAGNLAAGYSLSFTTVTENITGTPMTVPNCDMAQPPNCIFVLNLTSGTLGPGIVEDGVLSYTAPPYAGGEGGMPMYQTNTHIHLTPNPGTILCADPPPDAPVSLIN